MDFYYEEEGVTTGCYLVMDKTGVEIFEANESGETIEVAPSTSCLDTFESNYGTRDVSFAFDNVRGDASAGVVTINLTASSQTLPVLFRYTSATTQKSYTNLCNSVMPV